MSRAPRRAHRSGAASKPAAAALPPPRASGLPLAQGGLGGAARVSRLRAPPRARGAAGRRDALTPRRAAPARTAQIAAFHTDEYWPGDLYFDADKAFYKVRRAPATLAWHWARTLAWRALAALAWPGLAALPLAPHARALAVRRHLPGAVGLACKVTRLGAGVDRASRASLLCFDVRLRRSELCAARPPRRRHKRHARALLRRRCSPTMARPCAPSLPCRCERARARALASCLAGTGRRIV